MRRRQTIVERDLIRRHLNTERAEAPVPTPLPDVVPSEMPEPRKRRGRPRKVKQNDNAG